jgi:succinate dehydrogenase membrane anchor subunit
MAVVIRREGAAQFPARERRSTRSFWPWFLQRLTGVVLVVLMFIHIGVNHFGNLGKDLSKGGERNGDLIRFQDVAYRLDHVAITWLWWIVDISLLAFVLFHGFNGIRNIAIDMGITGRTERVVTGFLTLVALVGLVFGIMALIAFRKYTG